MVGAEPMVVIVKTADWNNSTKIYVAFSFDKIKISLKLKMKYCQMLKVLCSHVGNVRSLYR